MHPFTAQFNAATASYEPLGIEVLAKALYDEVMRARALIFLSHPKELDKADSLLALIELYLDSDIPVEECLRKREVLSRQVMEAPAGRDDEERALNAFRAACVYIPFTTHAESPQAVTLVLRNLNEFYSCWTPDIDLEQLLIEQLERLQAADEAATRQMFFKDIPESRSRNSGLAS